VDHEKWGHLITLSSMASVEFPDTVIWVVDYNEGEMSLEFGWHQVATKS
jgi:hypothetical protein